MLRLRMLALRQDGTEISRRAADEIRDATQAIVSETEAMSLVARGRQSTGPHTFLQVRIARLEAAAGRAVDAARDGDVRGLRAHVRHFDTLTSAIRTVLRSTAEETTAGGMTAGGMPPGGTTPGGITGDRIPRPRTARLPLTGDDPLRQGGQVVRVQSGPAVQDLPPLRRDRRGPVHGAQHAARDGRDRVRVPAAADRRLERHAEVPGFPG
ncbi:MAG TPA: hypothetical protein VHF26_06930, partial [Trebonia sp.]|nr:hypothetical protein [Trebonia sp.]